MSAEGSDQLAIRLGRQPMSSVRPKRRPRCAVCPLIANQCEEGFCKKAFDHNRRFGYLPLTDQILRKVDRDKYTMIRPMRPSGGLLLALQIAAIWIIGMAALLLLRLYLKSRYNW